MGSLFGYEFFLEFCKLQLHLNCWEPVDLVMWMPLHQILLVLFVIKGKDLNILFQKQILPFILQEFYRRKGFFLWIALI